MLNVSDNLSHIHHMISEACAQAGRNPHDVTLLCVSKTKPIDMIKTAYQCGERHFGESYISEAVDKITCLKEQGYNDIVWHFIGPIQSNKTKHIAAHFDIVESVDRVKILDRLNDQRPEGLPPLQILVQVNISDEDQKQGCAMEDVPLLLQHARTLKKLTVIGLMGVARDGADEGELVASFEKLCKIQQSFPELSVLSAGMTHDAPIAIAHGSTEVRIGSAIFGAREYPKKA